MWLPTRALTTVGLDVGVDAVRMVALRHSRRQVTLVDAGEAPLHDPSGFGEADDPMMASAATAALLERLRIRRASVAVAISAGDAFLKRLVLPRRRRRALDTAIRSAIREDMPFGTEEIGVVWDARPSREDEGERLDVLAVAARRSAVDDRAVVVAQAGHVPVVVDVEALALANAHALSYPERSAGATTLVNVSRERATICLLQDGALAAALAAETATSNVTDIVSAVQRAVQRYQSGHPMFAGASRVLLSGEACQAPSLTERISHELRGTVEFFDPFRRVGRATTAAEPSVAGPSFAIAVGLAMRRKGD